jgi:hypothetical protein
MGPGPGQEDQGPVSVVKQSINKTTTIKRKRQEEDVIVKLKAI